MAWTTKVLKVLDEYRDKEGNLKSKREIVRLENSDGKHFDPCFQKTSFYVKDGSLVRGYAQGLNKYDFKWIDEHRTEINSDLASDWKAAPVETRPAEIVEDTPF